MDQLLRDSCQMKVLQRFQIWMVLIRGDIPQPLSREVDFFTPLLSIKVLWYFSIEVSWDNSPVAEHHLKHAPFTLVRSESIPNFWGPVVCMYPDTMSSVQSKQWSLR